MAADDAVSASAKGATFLILLQIGSRALTFALNQIVLRFLSPALLGAAVQLEFFVISAHHFARESLRVACQRQPEGGIQAVVNLSYLAIASGVPIVFVLAQGYSMTDSPDVPYFVEALRICELAAIIELLCEPAFVTVQQNMLYKTRAAAEASAVVVKTFATAGFVFWARSQDLDFGALPFAIGELAYCTTLTIVYLWQTASVATQQGFSLLPHKIGISPNSYYFGLFSKSLVSLSFSLYAQSGIKYLLTSGDGLISQAFATLEDQGKYALSSNYGGLIARMVFRPIEDSSRNLFAKLCGTASTETPQPAPTQQSDSKLSKDDPVAQVLASQSSSDPKLKALMKAVASGHASQEELQLFHEHTNKISALIAEQKIQASNQQQQQQSDPLSPESESSPLPKSSPQIQQAAHALSTLLRVYTIFSLLVSAIGPTAAPLLLRLVAGEKWSQSGAGEVLGIYAYCIPLLALNGVSEAFVAATASTGELHRQSLWMGAFSVGFGVSSWLFLQVLGYGAKGLVLANCVNMVLRIWFNLGYAKRFFGERHLMFSLTDLLPNIYAIAGSALVPSLLSRTSGVFSRYGLLGDLIQVGAIGLAFTIFVFVTERRFLVSCFKSFRS